MAKKSKGKLAARKDKRRAPARRQERRFFSHTSTNPKLVYGLVGLSALALGAGAWAYFYAQSFAFDEAQKSLPSYLVAGGALLLGITIWLATNAEPTVRVGDPGLAVEKGELRRMPWWSISKITFEPGALAIIVAGADELGVDWKLKLPIRSHPEAVGWLVKEALDRIPRRVDIDDSTLEKLPSAAEQAGQKLELEPLQVVGKRCAATDKIISYEPDARVCPRCERVYLRTSVPKKCKCGNSLLALRPKDAAESDDESVEDDDSVDSSDDHAHADHGEGTSSEKNVEAAES
jgi:hypothetical protein